MNLRSHILHLLHSLRDKAYRALFVETQIETVIPFQIRTMRARKGWTQKQLAERAGMAQARISVLESVSYEGAVNIKTLVKLAEAFDVGLIVRFAPFSEIAEWTRTLSRENQDVPDYQAELAAIDEEQAGEERTETIQLAVATHTITRFEDAHDIIAA